jgi:hypothetical protein
MRIDLPSSMLQYIDINGTSQFRMIYSLNNETQVIDYENSDEQIMLDVHYTQNPNALKLVS